MRTVTHIYEKYRIPPWLQLHQLRVAAVGKMIAEKIQGTSAPAVVHTGLFHDMGNILKFNLSRMNIIPGLITTNRELEYWRTVQSEFQHMYGADEHAATRAIVDEIGILDEARSMIRNMGFSKARAILENGNRELQIIEYADQRVAPTGVVSLEGRMEDGRIRYAGKYGAATPEEAARYADNLAALKEIESALCASAGIDPSAIDDAVVAPIVDELRTLTI